MSNDYIFQTVDWQTGQITTNDPSSFDEAVNQACTAVINRQMFAVLHRGDIILQNIKQNIVVFVIGPNSFTRIKTELPTCGIYDSIYAITGKSAAELGVALGKELQVIDRKEYLISQGAVNGFLEGQFITDKNLPYHSYSELMGGKIIKETIGNEFAQIFNVYFEGSVEFKALGQKIGLKRFATQWLYTQDYLNNQTVDYCCIDDSTCLLSALNVHTNRGDGQFKVEKDDKITWTEGINQFLHDKYAFLLQPNFFYGFSKISDGQILPVRSTIENEEPLAITSSIYKMVFADYECMVNNQILYDPYCALMKEDVDWLIRTQSKGKTTFRKNMAISCCKFNVGLCSPKEKSTPEKPKVVKIESVDLNYYNNLFNRMIVLGYDFVHYYLIPDVKESWKYTLLIGFSAKVDDKPFGKLGMVESTIQKVAGESYSPKNGAETIEILKNMTDFDLKISNRIHIYNFMNLNLSKTTLPGGGGKCAFAKYDIATVQIMKHYGELLTTQYFGDQSKKRGTLKEMFNLILLLEGVIGNL
jgi:hypothetical protein